jgi:hypothetical protein
MSIAHQIRDEASRIADFMIDEVLEQVTQNLTRRRWEHLRKRTTLPYTEQELEYMCALNMYVKYKILEKKSENFLRGDRAHYRSEMEKWRIRMDAIEFGLDWKPALGHLTIPMTPIPMTGQSTGSSNVMMPFKIGSAMPQELSNDEKMARIKLDAWLAYGDH